MSGAHRIQKPPPRFRLAVLLVPARVVWRAARAAGIQVADWRRQAAIWWEARWDRRDPFADEPLASPAPAAPIPVADEPEPEPAPLHLTPEEALRSLHTEHPHLPGEHITWRIAGGVVLGEVNPLDRSPVQQRADVLAYAVALNVGAATREVDDHLVLACVGDYADATFVVQAKQIRDDDTIPLRVYRETSSTLETQAIPDIEQVMSA